MLPKGGGSKIPPEIGRERSVKGGDAMLYEIVWLFFALGAGIFISAGLVGLILSPAVPPRMLKVVAVLVSLLIILTGVYISLQWNAQKKEIRVLTQHAEEALKQYLATHPRK